MKKFIEQEGFTLVEMLIVVLMLGVLTSIGIPKYKSVVEKSKVSSAMTMLKTMHERGKEYMFAHRITKDMEPMDYQPFTFSKIGMDVPETWTCGDPTDEGVEEACCMKEWCFVTTGYNYGEGTQWPTFPTAIRIKKGSTINNMSDSGHYMYTLEYHDNGKIYCTGSDEYCPVVGKEKYDKYTWLM